LKGGGITVVTQIRLVFAYTGIVSVPRSCSVSFTDSEGITHVVEITASSSFEAAVLATVESGDTVSLTPCSDRPRSWTFAWRHPRQRM